MTINLDFPGAFLPTKEDLEAWYLTTMAAEAGRKDFEINVRPGSEYAWRANGICSIAVVGFANIRIAYTALHPNTATGQELTDGAAAWGVIARPASASTGFVDATLISAGTATIPDGYIGTAANGTKIRVVGTQDVTAVLSLGQLVVTSEPIRVETTTLGAEGELAFGAGVQWDATLVPLLKRNFKVSAGGVTGGRAADSEEVLRARWIARLSNGNLGGNWAKMVTDAENVSASIENAWVFSSIQGPNSTGIALSSDADDRTVSGPIVDAVLAALVAADQGHSSFNVTTVTPEPVDIVVALELPLPITAGGDGGGWLDDAPWPSSEAVSVTAYDSGTGQITTTATVLGNVAVGSHVAVWVPDEEVLLEYIVSEAVIGGGFVKLKAVGGFSPSVEDCYISANCARLASYIETFRASMKKTGPGEKTTSQWFLPRAKRQPSAGGVGRQSLGSWLLMELQAANAEIVDCQWEARYTEDTTTPQVDPTVPASSYDPPSILTPADIAFVAIL